MLRAGGGSLKLGIFGGTFDPIHLGHLRTAEEIKEAMGLEKVYLIPSALPPHKARRSLAPFRDRLAMVQLAVGDSTDLEALDLEGNRAGPSYSVETLKELHHLFSPDHEIFFILGIDAFLEINTWREYSTLFEYAHFVIVDRPGYVPEARETLFSDLGIGIEKTEKPGVFTVSSGKTITLITTTLMDISSTQIRGLVEEGKSIRFLVSGDVARYIRKKQLYLNHEHP